MTNPRPSVADKRRTFRRLHEAGCFVIPNPWDVGGALYLQSLGFKAIATTSSGYAWSQGRPDGGVSRDMALARIASLVAATDVPVNADFESGFAADAAGVAEPELTPPSLRVLSLPCASGMLGSAEPARTRTRFRKRTPATRRGEGCFGLH
jgi:hypothetical protein